MAFNRTVVLRYRIHLEQCRYAPATINLRLAAVRGIAYEAADAGLLSPELAAGIRRVKGVRRLGLGLESIQHREEHASTNIFRAMMESSPLVAHTMPWTAMAFSLGLPLIHDWWW